MRSAQPSVLITLNFTPAIFENVIGLKKVGGQIYPISAKFGIEVSILHPDNFKPSHVSNNFSINFPEDLTMKSSLRRSYFCRSMRLLAFSLALVTVFSFNAIAQTTTFAQFNQVVATNDFNFTNNGTSGVLDTIPGGVPVTFTYSNIVGLDPSLIGNQAATLTITTGTTTQPGFSLAGLDFQPFNQTVTVRITRNTPAPPGVGGGSRTNLLTAVFSPAVQTPTMNGGTSGQSAVISPSTPGNVVTFTSHFLSFNASVARNLGLSFSSVNPTYLLNPNGFLNAFTAAGTGTFASNPVPVYIGPTAASVSVGGRVLAPNGQGLRNAEVLLVENGRTRVARTSTFGYFEFSDIQAGQAVVISVRSKRYEYQPQIVSLQDSALDLVFAPNE